MDAFGHRWQGYTDKLKKRWNSIVTNNDTVVIPGDISWAMRLNEAEEDFKFIESLNGRKIIGKGNHDYWWTTVRKMNAALKSWNVNSVDFLFNNAFFADGKIICGTRGWFIEERLQNINDADYALIGAREVTRLKVSLDAGVKLREELTVENAPLFVYLHFPPVFGDFVSRELVDLMKEYRVERCFYGHIHGNYLIERNTVFEGLKISIISADYLDFVPLLS